jgi:hypothetical protein
LIVGWNQPENNGGCPITGFSIHRDDAKGSDVTIEVNMPNDPQFTNNPTLRSALITNFES